MSPLGPGWERWEAGEGALQGAVAQLTPLRTPGPGTYVGVPITEQLVEHMAEFPAEDGIA